MHTFEQLATFIAVYENGSYSGAASALGKSRTTVREHVMAYEDTLGYPLFEIVGKKAVATDKAEQLYFRAKVVEKQSRELFDYSQALFSSDVHTLTITHDVFVPLSFMVETEQSLKQTYPHLVVNWLHRTRQEALAMLKAGTADFALMLNRGKVFAETEIAWKTLGNIHLNCYARRESPLAKMEQISLAHLQSETQYISENFLTLNVDFAKVSPRLHVVSNNDVLCELIKQDGWAVMPKEYMSAYLSSGQLVELSLQELPGSKMIGLNVFFPIGKDIHPVFTNVIECLVKKGYEMLA
ncbi:MULTISPECIES: LysR family transcriptional regulator [unclassified Photobacterium]|uniref:LysR family transcriptional regulator n=1 Tax=unclassified Photobacterium TaxID=2628852 RepID=UPI001EDD1974|nr:LysR family transcriptional regulator [Photobacterium sp. Ph6]MCG3875316.1 LysR family transcriptional regulator [Photobacterium sp. Ph5]